MAYNRVQARSILNASELSLFESSLSADCKALGVADLHRRVKRARAMRDKSRDLLRRQRLATRTRTGSKGGVSGLANIRTAKKAVVLEEMLMRFEAEASRRDASAQGPSGRRAAPSSQVTSSRNGAVGKSTAQKTGAAAKKVTVKKTESARKAVAATKSSPAKNARTTKAAAPSRGRPAAKVLREALDRKEAARDGGTPGPKRSGGAKAPAHADEASVADGLRATGPSVRARALASRLAEANLPQIQGHVSVRGRVNQAKRDQKG